MTTIAPPAPENDHTDRDGYTGPMPLGYPNTPCQSDGYGGCETPTPTATPVPTKTPTKVSTPPATHPPTATPATSTSSSAPTLPVTGNSGVEATIVLGFSLIAVGVIIVYLLATPRRRRRHRV